MTLHDQLRAIALHEFATAGYAATSLQRIADLAGTSKPSVLYHYASKEQLLADAITPALDELTTVIDAMETQRFGPAQRREFLESFVDALLAHREVLHLVINQATTLQDVPAFARAQSLMLRLAGYFDVATSSTVDKLRFGVALAGAAYALASADLLGLDQPPPDEVRSALLIVMTELLAPITPPMAAPAPSAQTD